MDKKIKAEDLFKSMKKGLGKFYKAAKDNANSQESLLKKEIDTLKNLRTEGRRYVRPRIHAQGGMKMIISATDRLTRRQIAIAKMKENELTKDSLKIFLHEARILARLDHPNIVPLHDIGIDSGGEPYFTMKLLSGESLGAIIKQLSIKNAEYLEKYSMPVLLDIFLKVCDAAAFAHSRNIVHRDLKPENIQVGDYGEVLLCDWGLAKDINLPAQSTEEINLSEILSQQTLHGIIKGTPGFMAPEQVEEDAGDITEKTDIYSLGCILYSLLTFHCPIDSDSLEDLMKDTLEGNVIPASERSHGNIPRALEAVMQKAMSVKPDNRYQTIEALASEVRGYLDGFATKAQKADFRTQLYLMIRRHKAISALILISFTLMSLIIVFFLIKLKDGERVAVNALIEAENRKIEKDKLSKIAAPEFLHKALKEFGEFKYKKSLKSAKLAKELDNNLTDAFALVGRLQLAHMNFFEAATTFSKIKNINDYKKLYDLCIRFDKERQVNIVKLVMELHTLNEQSLIPYLMDKFHSEQTLEVQQSIVLELYREFHNSPKSPKIKFINNGTGLQFTASSNSVWKVNHLNFFKGMQLQTIDLTKCKISDISALSGMPLKSLNISRTTLKASDIPSDLTIRELNLSYTSINDLSPIKDLPLKKLNITNASVKNLNILEDFAKLEHLILSSKQISKLTIAQSLKSKGIKIEIISK